MTPADEEDARLPVPPLPRPLPRGDGPEHEALYRLHYHLEARVEVLEGRDREAMSDRAGIHKQMIRHVSVLRLVQRRLNLLQVLMISVGLFALAGPDGLGQIGAVITGRAQAIGADGIATLAGFAIPLLYPLGRKIFLSVRPESKEGTQRGDLANGAE